MSEGERGGQRQRAVGELEYARQEKDLQKIVVYEKLESELTAHWKNQSGFVSAVRKEQSIEIELNTFSFNV